MDSKMTELFSEAEWLYLFRKVEYKYPEETMQMVRQVKERFGSVWSLNFDWEIVSKSRVPFHLKGLVKVSMNGKQYSVLTGIHLPLRFPDKKAYAFLFLTDSQGNLIAKDGSRLLYMPAYDCYDLPRNKSLMDLIDELSDTLQDYLVTYSYDHELYKAVVKHDRGVVQCLLRFDGYTVARYRDFDAMNTAVEHGDVGIVFDLLEAGAELTDNLLYKVLQSVHYGGTRAASKAPIIKLLLEHGGLSESGGRYDLQCLNLLLQYGADMNLNTDLKHAVANADTAVVDALLCVGAEADYDVLRSAMSCGNDQTLTLLLKHHHTDINLETQTLYKRVNKRAFELWKDAAKSGAINAVQYLVTAVPDILIPCTSHAWSAIIFPTFDTRISSPIAMYALLNYGPPLDGLRNTDTSPDTTNSKLVGGMLHRLVKLHSEQYIPLLSYLLDNGCDVNERDEHGRTALHYVATVEVARVLVRCGAEVRARDDYGYTAEDCARGGRGREARELQAFLSCL